MAGGPVGMEQAQSYLSSHVSMLLRAEPYGKFPYRLFCDKSDIGDSFQDQDMASCPLEQPHLQSCQCQPVMP